MGSGVSPHVLREEGDQRAPTPPQIGVSYKAAWFLCHRIRESMRDATGGKLGGPGKIVEADEVYIGGKPRKDTGRIGVRRRRIARFRLPC